jgi:phospholipase C
VVTLGEQLIARVYNALRAGPKWDSTLLIITYDEHGGCYDHVPPPAATPPSPVPTQPFNFDRFGVRVPAVLVSPYIAPGTILRPRGKTPFDHTSISRTLRERFGIAEPLSEREAVAPDLSGVFNLPAPTNQGPSQISALAYIPTPAEVAEAHAMPLNHMQQGLVEIAGHLPATVTTGDFGTFIAQHIEVLRHGVTATEATAKQDAVSALALIKTRLGNLFRSI